MYERLLTRRIASAARSVFLLGPRQVGKSTILASLRPDLTINLASPAAFRDYSSHPDRLEAELRAVPTRVRTVLLDEVQRVPALFDVVQVLLDDERGLLLEHFVATELQRRLGTQWPRATLFHFRTRQGAEVDFVVQIGRETWGIEVKHARDVDRRSPRGFEALAEHAPELKRRIVVFLGPRRMKLGDAEVIPLREFLDELPA